MTQNLYESLLGRCGKSGEQGGSQLYIIFEGIFAEEKEVDELNDDEMVQSECNQDSENKPRQPIQG